MLAGAGQARIETLTVLFTDLVDSTGRRVRSGEEAADQLRQHHDRLLRVAILSNTGVVAKHTGDGIMATFAGASDAISAAVAIQQSVDADNRNRSGAEPVQVRIGLSAGDVSVENGDVFGLPVVEAQRLEAAAGAGEIFVSSLARALARGRGGHEFESLGELDLKGLDEPLAAARVVWQPLATDDQVAVRPPALAQHGGFAFAGRAKERAALDDAWTQTAAGACRLVFLAGEPGIGKTRLASEFASAVAAGGGTVLAGRCDEMVSEPYQPFAEALRFQLTRPDGTLTLGDEPAELVRLAPDLPTLAPGVGGALSSTPDAERIRFFEAVRSWLAQLAGQSPLLLVLDDIHWADAGSLLLMRHVVATDPVPRLCVLVTYRDTDLDRTHPLSTMLSDFHRRADAVRISLRGLGEAEVAEFVTLASGQPLDDDARRLVAALSSETGGNPFFAGEVLRHLVESGSLHRKDGRWVSESLTERDLPEGVREVVGRRLSVLPETTQQILTAASVIGARFDLDLLVVAANSDEDAVIDALDPAIAAQLMVETGFGRYQFSHALIRSTLHHELSTTRRARLHRAIGQAILQRNADDINSVVTDLAYHFGEAGAATPSEEALQYARQAAELALTRLAPDEAVRWSHAALDHLDDEDLQQRADLLGLIARAETLTGSTSAEAAQDRAARAALDIGDISAAIEILGTTNRLVHTSDQPAMPERVALLEEMLGLVDASDVDLRVKVLGWLAFATVFSGDLDRTRELREEVARLAPTASPEVVGLLCGMFFSAPASRIRADAVEVFGRLQARIDHLPVDQVDARIRALLQAFYGSVLLGDGEGIRRNHATVAELLADFPHPLLQDEQALHSVMLATAVGEPDELERLVVDFAAASARHGRPGEAELYSTVGLIGVAWERDGMETLVDIAVAMSQQAVPAPGAASVAASALSHAGRYDEAVAMIDEQLSSGLPDLVDDVSWPVAAAYWADAAVSNRHVDLSDHLYQLLRPLAGTHLVTGGFYGGSVALHLGRLASVLELPETADWFEQALAEHVVLDGPAWIARTHLNWAEHLSTAGDDAGARDHAQLALDAIGERNYRVTAQRAGSLLTA